MSASPFPPHHPAYSGPQAATVEVSPADEVVPPAHPDSAPLIEIAPRSPEEIKAVLALFEQGMRDQREHYLGYVAGKTAQENLRLAIQQFGDDVPPSQRQEQRRMLGELQAARADGDFCLRKSRDAEWQLKELRVSEWDCLATIAEAEVALVKVAADGVRKVLADYREAWERAANSWNAIEAGTRAAIADRDTDVGFDYRAPAIHEFHVPECPIPDLSVLKLVPRPSVIAPPDTETT